MKKIILILQHMLLILFAVTVSSFAQVDSNPYPQIIPSSPTVAAIEKFGNYPISYNTGTVSISTDLYSFPLGKGLNLDIRLDYHSSGIKVEDVSGRVGTGWALFAGGCISRQIRGMKDESMGSGFYNFIKTHKGYKFPNDMLDPINAKTADSIAKDLKDSSPDIFSLNLLGRSYKLFIGNDGEFHTIPYSNLKFKEHSLTFGETGGGWEIIDESGIRYIFGPHEETATGNRKLDHISAWWLSEVISAGGNTLVSFEYKASNPVYAGIERRTQAFPTSSTNIPDDLVKTYISEKKHSTRADYLAWDLYKINIPGKGSVVFEAGTSRQDQIWKLISEIKYYDNKNILINKYSLNYEHQSGRPFLSQILKTDPNGVSIKYRTFSYYPYLPVQNSYSQDFWGYYNGVNNQSLYPEENALMQFHYTRANRNPTPEAVAGTIKDIIYPTGGKTLFEFENNKIYSHDRIYTYKKNGFSHVQTDYGEVTSETFTNTILRKVNVQIEMAVHPAGLYDVDIQLMKIGSNIPVIHYTDNSVPGNGFINMGTDSNGMQRFVLNIAEHDLYEGTYKWVTSIIPLDEDRPRPIKPSPIKISNTYYSTVFSETYEKLVGGLRIAQISNYNSDGKLTEKVCYKYLDKTGKCSGYGAPIPKFLRQYVVTENVLPAANFPIYSDLKLIEIGEVDLNQYSGSAVQYTYVTEERIGEGSVSLKTDYEYRKREYVRNELPHPNGLRNDTPYSPNDYEEGLLISKTDYELRNNSYTPIRNEYNSYVINDFGADIPSFRAISLTKYFLTPQYSPEAKAGPHYLKYQLGTYDYRAAKVYLSSKKTEEITSQGTITNTNDYFYENTTYQQPTRSRQTNSNGLINEVSYKYCYDENTTITNEMKNRNILSPSLHTTNKVNNIQTKLTDVLYEVFPGNILEPKTVRIQTAASTPYSEITYHNYDKYGNPVYLSRNQADQILFIWSYSGQYPIAEIKNATFTEVETAVKSVFSVTDINALSAQTIPNEAKLKDSSLQKALPNALVSTYTYKPLVGILTMTSPSGVTTYYDYDPFGRLKETYIYKDNIVSPANKQVVQSYDYHYQNQ